MSKRFSASSAAQLMACPGSANLALAIPGWVEPVRDDTAGAKGVGTLVHSVLEPFHAMTPDALHDRAHIVLHYADLHYLKRRLYADDDVEALRWLLSVQVARRVTLEDIDCLKELREFSPKMLRFIGEAAFYMSDLLLTLGPATLVRAEQHLTAHWLTSKPGTTPDVTITSHTRLEVVDYKSGSIPVSPVDNDQLLFYAACAWADAPGATEFTLHIVQPGNMDSWTAPIEYLKRWMLTAQDADERIINQDLTLTPSDHCTFCPANPHTRGDKGTPLCPAMLNKLYPPIVDEAAIFSTL